MPTARGRETPPRAWGRLALDLFQRIGDGNTPTSVGKTLAQQGRQRPVVKHPHERGEDMRMAYVCLSPRETPPRAWGRLRRPPAPDRRGGNTPTSVGKILGLCTTRYRPEKHPHERGEDRILPEGSRINGETPPRAWGRHIRRSLRSTGFGNTPTSVGKTEVLNKRIAAERKHPHERGEDMLLVLKLWRRLETPPRAWGRRHPGKWRKDIRRNTPTSVGKTEHPGNGCLAEEKHPHERGEDHK